MHKGQNYCYFPASFVQWKNQIWNNLIWKLMCILPHSICVSLITPKADLAPLEPCRRKTTVGLTVVEQFQIILMVEWAKGVGNSTSLKMDRMPSRVRWVGRALVFWYHSKLGCDFSKQLLYCHCWKWGVKFRPLKRMQLHPDLTGMKIPSVVNK